MRKHWLLLVLTLLFGLAVCTKAQVQAALVGVANVFTQQNTFRQGVSLLGTTGTVTVTAATISQSEVYTLPGLPGTAGYALCIGSVAGRFAYCEPPGGGAGTPTVNQVPTSLSFGSVMSGTSSAPRTVLVENTGTALLTFTGSPFTFTGANASQFSETNTCSTTLDAGWLCTVAVTFSPTTTGAKSASLNINSNATGSPQLVTLTGTGA